MACCINAAVEATHTGTRCRDCQSRSFAKAHRRFDTRPFHKPSITWHHSAQFCQGRRACGARKEQEGTRPTPGPPSQLVGDDAMLGQKGSHNTQLFSTCPMCHTSRSDCCRLPQMLYPPHLGSAPPSDLPSAKSITMRVAYRAQKRV